MLEKSNLINKNFTKRICVIILASILAGAVAIGVFMLLRQITNPSELEADSHEESDKEIPDNDDTSNGDRDKNEEENENVDTGQSGEGNGQNNNPGNRPGSNQNNGNNNLGGNPTPSPSAKTQYRFRDKVNTTAQMIQVDGISFGTDGGAIISYSGHTWVFVSFAEDSFYWGTWSAWGSCDYNPSAVAGFGRKIEWEHSLSDGTIVTTPPDPALCQASRWRMGTYNRLNIWRWGAWSAWQDAFVGANANREVETRQINQ